jgi:hypothetical protein
VIHRELRHASSAANRPQVTKKKAEAMVHDDWRFCVAPMMDWTDRHCRVFHRQLSRRARLYTEMVTTGAVLHGDLERLLGFDPHEQPVALQLGGSEPDALARSARIGEARGYAEINLNCGCPSERVQRGAFGACLMAEPALVADCVKAMRDAVSVPVTVKHRIGLGRDESYDLVRDFVGALRDAGCGVFVVHARNAWLDGLSPKENREVPPLRHAVAYRLKAARPRSVAARRPGRGRPQGSRRRDIARRARPFSRCWRRRSDSNPRWGCPQTRFRVWRIRSLCHLSGRRLRCSGGWRGGWRRRRRDPRRRAARASAGAAHRLGAAALARMALT